MGGTHTVRVGQARRGTPRVVGAGALLLLLVMLTGCVQVRHESRIAPDLTGTTHMRIAVSRETIDTLSALGEQFGTTPGMTIVTGEDFARSIEGDVGRLGGTVTAYESDRYIGADVVFPFRSLDEMQTQINALLGSTNDDMGMMGMMGDAPVLQLTATSTADRVRIEGKIDPLSALGGPDGIASFSPELARGIAGDPDAVIALSFEMPGMVLDADAAATRSGTAVAWAFPIGSPATTFFAESDRSGGR